MNEVLLVQTTQDTTVTPGFGLSLFETRLIVTAAVVGLSLISAYAGRVAVEFLDEFFDRYSAAGEYFSRVPTSLVPARLVFRLLLLGIGSVTGLILLVVWGRHGIVGDLATVANQAVPLVVRLSGTLLLVGALVIALDLAKERITMLSDEVDRVDEHEEQVLIRLTHLLIVMTVGLAVVSLWTDRLDQLLVGAGFLGIVLGMASRQVLGSALAGFVLMFSRPFEIGDWVEIGDDEGTVTDITIMHTRLRSFSGESVTVPNDRVEASTVTNRSDRGRLRLEVDVSVDYDTDIEQAKQVALDAVEEVDTVLAAPGPEVVGIEFGDSGITLRARFWIDNPSANRMWQTRTDAIQAITTAYRDHGIEMPYPHRTVELPASDENSPAEVGENRPAG